MSGEIRSPKMDSRPWIVFKQWFGFFFEILMVCLLFILNTWWLYWGGHPSHEAGCCNWTWAFNGWAQRAFCGIQKQGSPCVGCHLLAFYMDMICLYMLCIWIDVIWLCSSFLACMRAQTHPQTSKLACTHAVGTNIWWYMICEDVLGLSSC